MVSVPIGRLDRKITLRRRVVTRGDAGGMAESFENVATVWGEKLDVRGQEFIAAQQTNAEISTRFRIRWRSDLNAGWRMTCEGKDYEIVGAPIEIGRRQWLEIMASVISGDSQDFEVLE